MAKDDFSKLSPNDRSTLLAVEDVLTSTLLDVDDISASLTRLAECFHLRERVQDEPFLDSLTNQSGRDERSLFTSRGGSFLEALAVYPALRRELVDCVERHHADDAPEAGTPYPGIPVQVCAEDLHSAGWSVGTRARMTLLRTLTEAGYLQELPRRWFAPVPHRPAFPVEIERRHSLMRFLELLTRTISQRLSRVEGSHFAAYGYIERPELIPHLGQCFLSGYAELLKPHAIPWSKLPLGQEHRFAMVHLSVITGMEQARAEQARLSPVGAELVLSTVGADVCRRIGNQDAAKRLMRGLAGRTLMAAAQAEGGSTDRWLRQHCQIQLQSVRRWLQEPAFDSEEGQQLANGGFAGVAAVHLMHLLAAVYPGGLSLSALQQRMRQLCSRWVADPGIVALALNNLEHDDQVMKTMRHGELFYGARRPAQVVDIELLARKVAGLREDFRPLRGLVHQILEGHPAGWGKAMRLIVPREVLPSFEEEGRKLREHLLQAEKAKLLDLPQASWLEQGYVQGLCISQSCISPVHFKRKNRDYK